MDYHERLYWEKQYKAGNFGEVYEWLGSGDDLLPFVLKELVLDVEREKNDGGASSSSSGAPAAAAAVASSAGGTGAGSGTTSTTSSSSSATKRILHVGCGNSLLGVQLEEQLNSISGIFADAGTTCSSSDATTTSYASTTIVPKSCRTVVVDNLDYSQTVINQMKERFPEHNWYKVDVVVDGLLKHVADKKNSVHAVIEKGLADALLANPDGKKRNQALAAYLQEICAVLATGGNPVKKASVASTALIFTLEGKRMKEAIAECGGLPASLELKSLQSCRRNYAEGTAKNNEVEDDDEMCSLLVLRKRVKEIGVFCQKCKKKNLYANITAGSRCGRCGCLHRP
ncbi:unnamed protein product [Amoebophrya sp. A120]|nr:unnamed protein product [Amoebophrya sp. A120]|eukprot:GSA120T00017226001.1